MNLQLIVVALLVVSVLVLIAQVVLLLRKPSLAPFAELSERLQAQLRNDQRDGRTELNDQLIRFGTQQVESIELLRRSLSDVRTELQNSQQHLQQNLNATLTQLRDTNVQSLNEVRNGLTQSLTSLQKDNAEKLDRMRETVDEKLTGTLNERLDASFKQVSEKLESVHRGLGEMQELASGVGDLKRVLTNVKTRGMFGETQLSMLLEQVFTPEQYGVDIATVPGSAARVEFAIKFPGRGDDGGTVWLPIDSKFPTEDYERLMAAQEAADKVAVEAAGAALELKIRAEAKKIADKYVQPPHTTDFAILFLPTENLYAEVLRRPGLFERLQRELKVTVAGPTTLLALLNALQMGFRSIAIEKRSGDVWNVLSKVKVEFGKYAGMVEKANGQLATVQRTLGDNAVRVRALERSLRDVQVLDVHKQDPAALDLQPQDDEYAP
ncbi:DNA recombination protein RmuC [Aquilutibacter rugosus]|jgi:DNA recombination protein RmuC|uniref:DNA recombination protein RmuC n=1 Tax=Aquilutibacter rugosus TaxID=3115820 RepID=UPI002F3E3D28